MFCNIHINYFSWSRFFCFLIRFHIFKLFIITVFLLAWCNKFLQNFNNITICSSKMFPMFEFCTSYYFIFLNCLHFTITLLLFFHLIIAFIILHFLFWFLILRCNISSFILRWKLCHKYLLWSFLSKYKINNLFKHRKLWFNFRNSTFGQ